MRRPPGSARRSEGPGVSAGEDVRKPPADHAKGRADAAAPPVPAIEGLAARLRRSRVPAQTDVFRKGDSRDEFCIIESGRVAVLDEAHEIRRLGPGDAFGEIARLRSGSRTATVRTLEDTELAPLSCS
jgi:Cyclic nucleotide-binding domain